MTEREPICADCGGWDIEWMYHCQKHKGVEYCRGCECPYCADEDDDEYPLFDDELLAERAKQEEGR